MVPATIFLSLVYLFGQFSQVDVYIVLYQQVNPPAILTHKRTVTRKIHPIESSGRKKKKKRTGKNENEKREQV